MSPWEGGNGKPDFSRFNLSFWQHYDRVVDAMCQKGIIAHIMIKVYNKRVNWPQRRSPEEGQYLRWLIARYASYPNVIWDFSKESQREHDLDYKLAVMRQLHELDPYRHLITTHDDGEAYDSGAYDELLDYRSDQTHKDLHETILKQRAQRRWPVANVEFAYEHGPKGVEDRTYGVIHTPEEHCRRAWEILTAGGYPAYYYTFTAWDVIRPEDTPKGYAYFRYLRDFFGNTKHWMMEPSDHLVSEGYCLANAGEEYVIFLNSPKSFTLRIDGASRGLRLSWFHPFTGRYTDGGSAKDGLVRLTPPGDWRDMPIILKVGEGIEQ
jgi:hypothetical protein